MSFWALAVGRLPTVLLRSAGRSLPPLLLTLVVMAALSPLAVFAHGHEPRVGADDWCTQVAALLKRTAPDRCSNDLMAFNDIRSVKKRLIPYVDFTEQERRPSLRVLVLGGIHGDEWTTVSLVLNWIAGLERNRPDGVDWRLIPLINPDGFFQRPSTRVNANGVDINRNFPTPDWDAQARNFWRSQTRQNPRRNPGVTAGSEPETQLVIHHIEQFKPDVILSLHAPYGLVDFDGPQLAPMRFGTLPFRKLKAFPGSLGSYAGGFLGIPVVTVELDNARQMPGSAAQARLWRDLVAWLQSKVLAKPIQNN
jgi:protein MpaA